MSSKNICILGIELDQSSTLPQNFQHWYANTFWNRFYSWGLSTLMRCRHKNRPMCSTCCVRNLIHLEVLSNYIFNDSCWVGLSCWRFLFTRSQMIKCRCNGLWVKQGQQLEPCQSVNLAFLRNVNVSAISSSFIWHIMPPIPLLLVWQVVFCLRPFRPGWYPFSRFACSR